MKKILVFILGLMLCSSVFADGLKQYDKVIITLMDGRVFDIAIDAESYIYSFVEEKDGRNVQFIEVIGTREEYLFERNEVKSMKFIEAVDTAIDNIEGVDENNPMRFIDGVLTFHNSLSGKQLFVYDTAGNTVLTAIVKEGGMVSLMHLSAGVYVAKVNDINLKVVIR
jgi:hypothetical protein